MKSVKFLKPWSMYSPGDIAGFDEKRAEALIDAKAAESYDGGAETPPECEVSPQSVEQPAAADEIVDPKPARSRAGK